MPKKQTRKTQPLPVQWEELTASDFPEAVRRAQGVCVLPIGVIEKRGPHLLLGTDVMAVREASVRAAQREYAVAFPYYYFGQIYEARHQPGKDKVTQRLQDEFHGRAQGPLAPAGRRCPR